MANKGPEMTASLTFSIEDDIRLAVLSFKAIAIKHGVTINDVNAVWDWMCECEQE